MPQEICRDSPLAGLPQAVDFQRIALPGAPADVALRLRPLGGLIWLDSGPPATEETLTGSHRISILTAAPSKLLIGNLGRNWERLSEILAAHSTHVTSEWPMPAGGLFGWVGFDGDFVFGVYPRCLIFLHHAGEWFDFGGLANLLDEVPSQSEPGIVQPLDFKSCASRGKFVAAVVRAQEYIAAGDIYQVNLSYPWRAVWPEECDALMFYQRLRSVSPTPFGAFADLADVRICSSSPECFLQISGREIRTRPIKGTRPRFPHDPVRDAAAAEELLRSDKERAELLMITDLERNDLGRVCEFGSIAAPELWRVERFAQVFHLVSTVTGRLRAEVDHVEALRACFPGGSITGAPKKRALEIIAELERHHRGIYTGAIGYFGFNGESQFSIAIRTAVESAGEISFHVGAGIVADSVPEREYEETLHKAAGILQAAAK